jgi:hypothetical protein
MYRRTEHQNAITKLVREKRMILQVEAARKLNKDNIKDTVKILVEQGKIKRQKVKVRGKVGNLTDQYLLYGNDVKQAEILEYEKELINLPYESPLKKNHCYKKTENPVEQELKDISQKCEILNNSNVIDMQEYININNKNINIIEYSNQRVVTAYEIADLHGREVKRVTEQFERNRKHFIEGIDFFIITKEKSKVADCDFKKYFKSPRQKEIYLFTETGYLMLVKSFVDDLSWDIQRQLVQCYFKIKDLKEKQSDNLPITRQDLTIPGMYDMMKLLAGGVTDLNDRVKVLENTIDGIKKVINN